MGNSKSTASVSRSSSKLKADDDTGFNTLQLEKLPLSREELKKLKTVFAKHAKGEALDFAGFQNALKDSEVKKQDMSTLERMFKIFDRSGDGLINFREFVVGISTLSKGTLEEQIRFAFEVYDSDGSGTISETEMAGVFLAVMSLSWGGANYGGLDEVRGIAREIIKDCDHDKDGVLREDEFIEAVYRYPILLEFMGKMGAVIDMRRKERIEREERKRALENPELTRGRSHTSTDYRETLKKVGLGDNDPQRALARDSNDLTSQRSMPILVANGTATLPRTRTTPTTAKGGLGGLFSGLFTSKSRDHLHLPAHGGTSSSAPSSPQAHDDPARSSTPRAEGPGPGPEPQSGSPAPSPSPNEPSPRPSPRFAAPITDPNDTRALDEAHPTRPRGETQPPVLNQTFRIV